MFDTTILAEYVEQYTLYRVSFHPSIKEVISPISELSNFSQVVLFDGL